MNNNIIKRKLEISLILLAGMQHQIYIFFVFFRTISIVLSHSDNMRGWCYQY